MSAMEPLPDFASLADDDLRELIEELEREESDISYRRRLIQGRIDILRAERTARLRNRSSRVHEPREHGRPDRHPVAEGLAVHEGSRRLSHIYCPECGFQNPEAANFCARCGAHLVAPTSRRRRMTFTPEEAEDDGSGLPEGIDGPALIVRSGGGRAGETFSLERDSTTIGRSPDCEIFLDDVTVSRKHSVIVKAGEAFRIDDEGSLNGTFVNKKRVESAELEDGDELQIGKYRLTYLSR